MDEKTKEALEASIAHWEEIVTLENVRNIRMGSASCALCEMFDNDEHCTGCPVSESTNQAECHGTPFGSVYRAWDDWMYAVRMNYSVKIVEAFISKFRKAAQSEASSFHTRTTGSSHHHRHHYYYVPLY